MTIDTKTNAKFECSVDGKVQNCGERYAVGIDLGTTTISAAVIDLDTKEQVGVFTLPHESYIKRGDFSEQDVWLMLEKAESILDGIYADCGNIECIGLTGQMHGIVYVDERGAPLSNLMNWQDKRADLAIDEKLSACEKIKILTGENVSAGYGIATHFYNLAKGIVPKNACSFCSIMDLLALKLCGAKRVVVHTSVAASFGLFDIKEGCFMTDKLSALGIDEAFLPRVTKENEVVGDWRGIPVCVAIGDNQASFLGSVKDHSESVLVNFGTGSQISAVGDICDIANGVELRPLIGGKNLLCGSALCGGAAYALIEKFFRSYAQSAGFGDSSQYEIINDLAEKAYENGEKPLCVDTAFCGTRTDPCRRGKIEKIDMGNFTPSALVLGVINGMCRELFDLYSGFKLKKTQIVASGGAARKNKVLISVLEDIFGMTASLSTVKEEAATGAALFSALTVGKATYSNGFGEYIKYDTP
ncbi:MAG: hypothetical protein E7656_08035 [Ruminococcaceae bacterium]|nr:hypothetical protein [Oscillospiraceae bacterium]